MTGAWRRLLEIGFTVTSLGVLTLGLTACPKKDVPQGEPVNLVERGRSVYAANCTACHSADPKKEGSLGPAVAGASRELLEVRILRAGYLEGYKPKRDSKIMVALPHLKNEIDGLYEYLNSN